MLTYLKDYKNYVFLTLFILLVIIIPSTIKLIKDRQKAVVSIAVLNNYEIGELVTLDASASKADKIIWKIIPETPNFKIIDSGRKALFSSTEPIDYTVIVIASRGQDLDCQVFKLSYGKKKVIKKPELTEFEQQMKNCLIASNLLKNKKAALRLAGSFRLISRMIKGEVFETVDGIVLATAQANSAALDKDLEAWKPFLRQLQTYLEDNPPTTIDDHARVWDNIATALEKL